MDRTPSRDRCSSPQRTACSTQRKTVSQLVRKRRAVSFQDSTLAQLARNHTNEWVVCILPEAHGTISTTMPHLQQFTRRMAYIRKTTIPQRGTNSNDRTGKVS